MKHLRETCVLGALALAGCATGTVGDFDEGAGGGSTDRSANDAAEAIRSGTRATAFPEAALIDMKVAGKTVAYCSGAVIAPRIVLTAGHCVHGFESWRVSAPYAPGKKTATASEGLLYDFASAGETVPPDQHDVGLLVLDTAIELTSYPELATSPVHSGASVVNVGRIHAGTLSHTNLYASRALAVVGGASYGFPYAYAAADEIEPGDSGGPDFLAGTHTLVAVNSGGGSGLELLGRVDLVAAWIAHAIAAHGGGGGAGAPEKPPACAHSVCDAGGKLAESCSPCAAALCAADAYCCTKKWDATCVGEVESVCAESCQASATAAASCATLGTEGACSGEQLSWCDGALHDVDCASLGRSCGWNAASGWYDCL